MDYNISYHSNPSKKEKVTMTLTASLLKNLDQMAKRLKTRSRSDLMENILSQWFGLQAKKKLEEDAKAYYLSLGAAEKREDASWAKIASRNMSNLWD